MSLERSVCDLVKKHWVDLHPNRQAPDSLVFLKVAGKTSTNAAIIAMIIDASIQRPVAIAKIPRNPRLAPGLEHEYEAMLDLRESIHDTDILAHIPYHGTVAAINGVKILIQAAGNGYPMVREMNSRETIEALYARILSWMFAFHSDGAEECLLEGENLRELVESPITQFMEKFGNLSSDVLSNKARQCLTEIPKKVTGQKIHLCRQHGDFNAHNILVDYNGKLLNDFSLIDWEDYQPRQLPIHDLNHFFTSNSHLLRFGMSPVESYAKLVLSDGWYRDLYVRAVADYELRGLIDRETFWILVPLYFIEMCFRIADVQREQQDTALTWVKRMNAFITRYLRKVE